MQRESFERQRRQTRTEFASVIFEWIEGLWNPVRVEPIGLQSPAEFETLNVEVTDAAKRQWG